MGQSQPLTPLEAAAAEAVVRLSRRLGIGRVCPKLLSARRRITIQVTPNVVARAISNDDIAMNWMRQELDIVHHLARDGAPVVGPSAGLSAGPHVEGDFVFTLWEFVGDPKADRNNAEHVALAAKALRHIHEGLTGFRDKLPDFLGPIDNCRRLLVDETKLDALCEQDRRFLLKVFDHLRVLASVPPSDMRPIHGDAHLGNVFITAEGALWDDFEDACFGPREWDISWFYKKMDLAVFEPLNRELVSTLHHMHKLCIAVWSYQSNDPERHKAAQSNLAYLRDSHPF